MPRKAPSRKVAGLSAGLAAEPRRGEDRCAPALGVSAAAAAEGQQQQHGHKSQEKNHQGTKEQEGEPFVALLCVTTSPQVLCRFYCLLSSVPTSYVSSHHVSRSGDAYSRYVFTGYGGRDVHQQQQFRCRGEHEQHIGIEDPAPNIKDNNVGLTCGSLAYTPASTQLASRVHRTLFAKF